MFSIAPIIGDSSGYGFSDVDLVDELYLTIFERLIDSTSLASIQTLALVSRKWHQLTNRQELGRWVFEWVGIPFPSGVVSDWKYEHRKASGDFFDPSLAPDIWKLVFADEIDISKGRVAWFQDGFIHYEGNQFKRCLFANLARADTVTLNGSISALAVIGDKIVCGLQSGEIAAYGVNSLEHHVTTQAHTQPVLAIFPFRGNWVSASERKVVQYDLRSREQITLLTHEQDVKGYKCFNNCLFFLEKSDVPCVFDPHYPEKGVRVLSDFVQAFEQAAGFMGWGNQVLFFDVERGELETKSYVSRFRINEEHCYKNHLGYKEDDARFIDLMPVNSGDDYPDLYDFKGEVAIIRAIQVLEDDTGDEEYLDVYQLYSFKNPKNPLTIMEPAGLFSEACTFMNNKFIYFTKDRRIVFMDFSLPR